MAESFADLEDFVLVDAALDDGVHLHLETGFERRVDRFEDLRRRETHVVEGLKDRLVHGVEAHGHALQARFLKGGELLFENGGVRRDGDVGGFAVDGFE